MRGTQLRETVEFLYANGAKEVHIRSACPPIMYGCKFPEFLHQPLPHGTAGPPHSLMSWREKREISTWRSTATPTPTGVKTPGNHL